MAAVAEVWSALCDLVLPVECAGCGDRHVRLRHGACGRCADELSALRPHATRPEPAPPGLPGCVALAPYDGALRGALLAYKERNRVTLAAPLGALLAEVVAAAAGGVRTPVLLVPVPSSARAARARHGDHMRRLADRAARRLRADGWSAIVGQPARALPKPDSAHLSSADRAVAAVDAFAVRAGRLGAVRRAAAGRAVILVDDIVTTGATLSVMTGLLARNGVTVDRAEVLAATRRRHPR